MAKNHPIPTISHTVNGYSRYDIPESVAFSASAGLLYPARCEFLNARECRYIQAGAVVRTNPTVVPTFSPFRIRLHRYFCPISLYHPEMRVNASGFDMRNMTTNLLWVGLLSLRNTTYAASIPRFPDLNYIPNRGLLAALGLGGAFRVDPDKDDAGIWPRPNGNVEGVSTSYDLGRNWVNADPVIAYYDIIRNYYGFSQVQQWSFAIPNYQSDSTYAHGLPVPATVFNSGSYGIVSGFLRGDIGQGYWEQYLASMSPLDDLYETSFYPRKGSTATYFDRTAQIYQMLLQSLGSGSDTETADAFGTRLLNTFMAGARNDQPDSADDWSVYSFVASRLPYGVAPSMADRLSRFMPNNNSADVSIAGVQTVRQLAIAAKTQAYADLLSAGGSRFTDWIKTFFAANVSHVDRPVLVYSSSFYMNSSPIFNQSGSGTLGSYAGVLDGQNDFGKRQQRYCFDEPGYLIDIFSIQPLYYWSGVLKDYAYYDKMDYFNPLFNEVGYQTVPYSQFGVKGFGWDNSAGREPCYNEFRASYDRVFGDIALMPGLPKADQTGNLIKTSWVQQRAPMYANASASDQSNLNRFSSYVRFVDVNQANQPFASTFEDNFYVNLYYNVSAKSLVTKNFATNLAVR